MEKMNILLTADENYLYPIRVMLQSLFLNNPDDTFDVYLQHDNIPRRELERLEDFCAWHGSSFHPVAVPGEVFDGAPTRGYLTKAMYYRLLAHQALPADLERILYLDPDTLILNPIRELYETGLDGCLYAGCIHTGLTNLSGQVNKARLNTYEAEGYYNSGVLVMNLAAQRGQVREADILAYVDAHRYELILPDQDILNGLYGDKIKSLDDSLYNYDVHKYETYRMVSAGEKNIDWVMRNTVVIHFCGKDKPWLKPNRNRLGILHKHYSALMERTMRRMEPALTGQGIAI